MSERPKTLNTGGNISRIAAADEIKAWGILLVGAFPYLLTLIRHLQQAATGAEQPVLRALPAVMVAALLVFLALTGTTTRVLTGVKSLYAVHPAITSIAAAVGAGVLLLPIVGSAANWTLAPAPFILVAWLLFACMLAAARTSSIPSRWLLTGLISGSTLIGMNALSADSLLAETSRLQAENTVVRETNESLHQQLFDAQTMYMDTFEQLRDTQIQMNNQFGGYSDPYQYGLSNTGFYPFHIYDAQPPLEGIPTLQELAGTAITDADIIHRVTKYYNENVDLLAERFQEDHEDRLKALFAMYILHISHAYGNDPMDASNFVEYLQKPTTHCALIAVYQSQLMDAFGLEWRIVGVGPLHQWLEASIDGEWEIFDGTANVWVNHGYTELLKGETRRFRSFYSPWMDETKPEARIYAERQSEDGYFRSLPFTLDMIVYHGGVGIQRSLTPGLGIYYPPALYCDIAPEDCRIFLINASES